VWVRFPLRLQKIDKSILVGKPHLFRWGFFIYNIMKTLNKYEDFLLLESVLLASNHLVEFISKINSPISKTILDIINDKKDINTDHNILDLSDKNDELKFITDVKTQKMIADGDDPFSKNKQSMKVGRIIKSILQKNGEDINNKDLEEFVNQFKSNYDLTINKDKTLDRIRIVEGEDIKFWYLVDNYQEQDLGGSELGNSCMRYDSCQDYFNIYIKNPDECKMVIFLNDDDKLIARSLFWKLKKENHFFLDRIYCIKSSDKKVIISWVLENIIKDGQKMGIFADFYKEDHPKLIRNWMPNMEVKLSSKGYFEHYPYVDTFQHYTPNTGILSSSCGELELTSTDGFANDNRVYCEIEGESYPEDETAWSEYHNSYIHRDNARWSEYSQDYFWHEDVYYIECEEDYVHSDDAVFSEHMDEHLIKDNAVQVFINNDKKYWYPKDKEDDEFVFIVGTHGRDNGYYIMDLATQDYNNRDILSKWAMKCYEIEDNEENKSKIKKHDIKLKDNNISELDSKLFDLVIKEDTESYVDFLEYYYIQLSNIIYTDFIDKVNNIVTINEEIKTNKIKEIEKAHNFLFNSCQDYIDNYNKLID
jgi:hypothetical protein